MITPSSKKIGELNGKWAMMFKLVLALNTVAVVPFIGWSVFVTTSLFGLQKDQAINDEMWVAFFNQGPRYTAIDATRDQKLAKTEVLLKLTEMNANLSRLDERGDRLEADINLLKKKLLIN